mmetsp:Transcript_88309/g.274486  ORF Transcript_88309/g.274486 Transcript_88309/m.274486 type:complete len:192 (+) Transcript_88309:72-647(+)|eukprot:CAMPEP_0204565298 /NCGR_PEP_ID=MMETSP0661-20131031/35389_1 /ASSEMBLY_ACC=CAM_ASM_000606 /TAXON_ID=109239 /ORGANISM="Alexandrium margalefi, Strain AMGDE01CS-322" /LENGTH=191 /DNA_ID=CAMNT_0051573031 /DNA_START=76 /DNA_END=651 /DNA_ORIENTATION=+
MRWLDGADEVLGRRKELDSLYTLIAACQHLPSDSGIGCTIAGLVGAWRHVASFLLLPVPEFVDRLRIPAHLNAAELAAISSAVSEWGECLEARVMNERSLSADLALPGPAESDLTSAAMEELRLLREQSKRTGFLLHQLALPYIHNTLAWMQAQERGSTAAKQVLASNDCLADFHRETIERSRSLSHLLAG